jgi:hypothetical protein
MNRAPGPTDRWWADHERSCGGSYTKIKEPAEFTAKQAKKKERELARAEKQKKKDKEVKAAPSVKQFFPSVEGEAPSVNAKTPDIKPPRVGKKAPPPSEAEKASNKKRKKEHAGDSSNVDWPLLGFPSSTPAVFSADGDEDGYFLVGDIQALFETPPSQSFIPTTGRDFNATGTGADARLNSVVDLTVSDSDNEQEENKPATEELRTATGDSAEVIEID